MISRFGCVLGRSLAPTRGLAVCSTRALSSSTALMSSSGEGSSRGGVTGYLQEKIGVTGAWTLGIGVAAYCLSKELYVVNSETVILGVVGGVFYTLYRKLGDQVAEFFDAKSDSILDLLNQGKMRKIANLETKIDIEQCVEVVAEARHDLYDIVQENNAMKLETEYRRRLHSVTNAVKRRLDYQVGVEQVQRKFEQKNLVQWLEKAVTDAVRTKQDESLVQCMEDLKKMSIA